MGRSLKLHVARALLLVAGLVLLGTGLARQRKVYERGTGEVGVLTYQKLRDWQVVVETTFTGMARRGDRLLFSYDRSVPPSGKRKCPT